ncbi:hypothetical protein KII95_08625 [Leuconostoc gelidum subsp. aenigmaticum]|uniref:helix-turn-helix domain-containing protein n=1 Tax=Leuconostoc gelidum TaxID=1244 RepID=UPI001CC4B7CD|nr:helix-turn-helix domain-containing protein [Leuconostoc gelidum]MBZ6004072.1 hypothetical protein [Leuconostoc gelidum subsp. aenigmaticum]
MAEEQDIKYFTQIPAWVDELDNISDFQVRLVGYIYTFENITGSAFPSNQRMAERFGKTARGVQNALSDLYKKGVITRTVTFKSDSKEIERRYLHVTQPPTSKSDGVYIENAIGYTSKVRDPIHRECVDNRLLNRSINRLDNTIVSFEEIWKLYPKKSGKSNAKKDFDKAIKSGVDSELIKSKLQEYLKQIEIKQTPGQYIKQGSTWFHQAGWEDEYDFTPEVKQTYSRSKREGVVPGFLKNKGLTNG